jgi:hypothetical protein
MSRIDKPMRGRRATKRLDVTDMRKVLQDRRIWNGLGIVVEPEDGGAHFELVEDDDGTLIDILIEVELMPDQIPLLARLSGLSGGGGRGTWTIPNVGDEVIVACAAGQIDFQPAIMGVLSSGGIPNGGGQGPASNRTIIVDQKVLVHDGAGGAKKLAFADELNDLRAFTMQQFSGAGHGHGVSGAATNSTLPIVTPVDAPTTAYPGSQVLEGK